MEYSDFERQICAEVRERLKDFSEVEVELGKAAGINRSGTILRVMRGRVGTVFYLSGRQGSVDEIVESIVNSALLNESTKEWLFKVSEQCRDVGFVKEHVRPVLISASGDATQELVSSSIFDLKIVYRIFLSDDAGVAVSETLRQQLGISKEDLHKAAIANVRPAVYKMCDLFPQLNEIDGLDPMTVISVQDYNYGAFTMLDDKILQNVAESMGGDLVILPSSVHEVIAVPFISDLDGLRSMVGEINQTVIDSRDVLSSSVYVYSKDRHELSCDGCEPVDLRSL